MDKKETYRSIRMVSLTPLVQLHDPPISMLGSAVSPPAVLIFEVEDAFCYAGLAESAGERGGELN